MNRRTIAAIAVPVFAALATMAVAGPAAHAAYPGATTAGSRSG